MFPNTTPRGTSGISGIYLDKRTLTSQRIALMLMIVISSKMISSHRPRRLKMNTAHIEKNVRESAAAMEVGRPSFNVGLKR